MQWSDRINGYGWVSIILHWVIAGIVITLWVTGDLMQGVPRGEPNPFIQLHISIAACTWILIWVRIIWRLKSGHPEIIRKSSVVYKAVRWLHYVLLGAIAGMLISGPVMVWSGGRSIGVFGWFNIPSLTGKISWLNQGAENAHVFFANLILVIVLLHVCGAFKHMMFNDDDIFIRMLVAGKKSSE